MRNFLLILTSFLIASSSNAQDFNSIEDQTDRLYTIALSKCLINEVENYGEWGFVSDSMSVVVEDVRHGLRKFPEFIGKHRIEYLSSEQVVSKAKSDNGVKIYTPFPIRVQNDTLSIGINYYGVEVKDKIFKSPSIRYSLSGGCRAFFILDPETHKFEFSSAELWGI